MILEAGRFMKGLRIILIAALFWILSSAAALADGCVGDYHVGNIIRTTIVAPSCVAKGVDQYQCSECGYIWIQEVPITDHTWKMETPAQTATCTNEGTEPILKCAVCGETTGGGEVPALGHDFGDWIVVQEATCAATGKKPAPAPAAATKKNRNCPKRRNIRLLK